MLGVDRVWETSPYPLAAFKHTDSELQLEGAALSEQNVSWGPDSSRQAR